MVLIKHIQRGLRTRELGKIKSKCNYCNRNTAQTVYFNRPINWFILGIIPIPYPSPNFDIIVNCERCNNVVNILNNEKGDVLRDKFIDVKSDFHKRDFVVQIECCDVCYFENKKKIVPSKWETKAANTVLHLCDKHKGWLEEKKFKNAKELINHISNWYSS